MNPTNAAGRVDRPDRVAGAVVGSAVGDALGAPFEFGPAGVYTARFPDGIGTMCGGGGWDPGEATDDTQMAVLVAESLLERGGLDLPDMFGRFRRWAAGDPKDIGLQTEDVLTSGEEWDLAAALHFQVNGRAAGNGSLMRAATSAVYFAARGRTATMDAARRIAALTHGDRAAWEGTAVLHELIRVALDGGDPLSAVPDALAGVHEDHRGRWAGVLAPGWHPEAATEFNGAVWPCLGTALWALRTNGLVRERADRRRGRGRGHRHGGRRDRRPGGCGVWLRRDPRALDGALARAAAGVRGPGAADVRSGGPGTAAGRCITSCGSHGSP